MLQQTPAVFGARTRLTVFFSIQRDVSFFTQSLCSADFFIEDFLTYSTYQMVDQHVVFGGTRWGGSFWHHNLEAPMTVQDMTRPLGQGGQMG